MRCIVTKGSCSNNSAVLLCLLVGVSHVAAAAASAAFVCPFPPRGRLFFGGRSNNYVLSHNHDDEKKNKNIITRLHAKKKEDPMDLMEQDDEDDDDDEEEEEEFLRRELEHLSSLEDIINELEGDEMSILTEEDFILTDDDDILADEDTLLELLAMDEDDDDDDDDDDNDEYTTTKATSSPQQSFNPLEQALLQGVVPADAGVGSGSLPGDCSFDPLNLSTKDYFKQTQNFMLNFIPDNTDTQHKHKDEQQQTSATTTSRPAALILRDYREAEIRHGRLAMLAVTFWPLQQILDALLIPTQSQSTTIIYGGTTLPYFSLLMTLIMLLLGYLDIYANVIRSEDAGEAYLPGECFWDPLAVLQGAPDTMKRNMQERELMNGRAAMIAFAAFVFEEATTHKPLIRIQGNEFLFTPAYQIPVIQEWLDRTFQSPSPALTLPGSVGQVDFVETLREVLEEEEELLLNQIGDKVGSSSGVVEDAAARIDSEGVSDVVERVTTVITENFMDGVVSL